MRPLVWNHALEPNGVTSGGAPNDNDSVLSLNRQEQIVQPSESLFQPRSTCADPVPVSSAALRP